MNKKALATVVFVAIIGGVLGLFTVLSNTGTDPPKMPAHTGPHHKLRFNLKSELIGVESEPPVDPAKATAAGGFEVNPREVEKRIRATCVACHGTPGGENGACNQPSGKCLPEHHPPKPECIKCHR